MHARFSFVGWLLLLFGLCPARADELPSGERIQAFNVVGYLPSYELKSLDSTVGKHLSHVIYFSVQPALTGALNADEITPDALEHLQKLRDVYGTRIQIAVGGWGKCATFAPVMTNTELRQQFVQALLKYCLEHKLDGVDFDWEFPQGKDENAAYSSLLIETKNAFHPHELLVTVALSSSQELSADAYLAVDRVHVMSYDHEGAEPATLAHAQDDLKKYVDRGVPKEKLILGLPFYGINRNTKPTALAYTQIVRQFRPTADQDSAGGYYFNGIATIQQKTRLAIDQGFGGVMVWQIGQDTRDESSLLHAIAVEVMRAPSGR
jgi:chitinase